MSKRSRILRGTIALGLFCTLFATLPWIWNSRATAFEFRLSDAIPIIGWMPFAVAVLAFGGMALHFHLRAPDVVITVTAQPTPLQLKFQEQDRRLERRERMKGDLFKLNGEIETFNADMDSDTRRAWANRPGPYGK